MSMCKKSNILADGLRKRDEKELLGIFLAHVYVYSVLFREGTGGRSHFYICTYIRIYTFILYRRHDSLA